MFWYMNILKRSTSSPSPTCCADPSLCSESRLHAALLVIQLSRIISLEYTCHCCGVQGLAIASQLSLHSLLTTSCHCSAVVKAASVEKSRSRSMRCHWWQQTLSHCVSTSCFLMSKAASLTTFCSSTSTPVRWSSVVATTSRWFSVLVCLTEMKMNTFSVLLHCQSLLVCLLHITLQWQPELYHMAAVMQAASSQQLVPQW